MAHPRTSGPSPLASAKLLLASQAAVTRRRFADGRRVSDDLSVPLGTKVSAARSAADLGAGAGETAWPLLLREALPVGPTVATPSLTSAAASAAAAAPLLGLRRSARCEAVAESRPGCRLVPGRQVAAAADGLGPDTAGKAAAAEARAPVAGQSTVASTAAAARSRSVATAGPGTACRWDAAADASAGVRRRSAATEGTTNSGTSAAAADPAGTDTYTLVGG